MTNRKAIILFDGVCNLCNGAINFIIDHDPKAYFKLGALQSDEGAALLEQYQIDRAFLDSLVLIENGKVFTKSTGALRIAKKLSGAWPLLYGLIIIPPFIRNPIYDWIARNRYKWFGKRDQCRMPTPELKARFL
ncbi:thiol-disulfide oxidoreductase DCC family protein [Penaeicola halotolerans]|uniref:thiol-disulfide oxidoreductase DCC family protein n=1 Tax=Penaeicola halotolerans TaxID=2793196 RepID=UPI001CF89EC7|nr:thiol-disulfide oxidoreductase DCC family protein [Penaeicola halotolerans]